MLRQPWPKIQVSTLFAAVAVLQFFPKTFDNYAGKPLAPKPTLRPQEGDPRSFS